MKNPKKNFPQIAKNNDNKKNTREKIKNQRERPIVTR